MKNRDYLIETLNQIGLSDKESTIYLLALELGSTTILNISKHTVINRSTIYTVIESLLKRGLMSVEIKGFKKRYIAESPDRLEFIFEQKKKQLLKAIPFLNELYQHDSNQSFIRYYEGIEAIKMLYLGFLTEIKPGEDYLVIGNQADWFSADPEFFLKFIQKRAKLNIQIRLLFQDSAITQKHKKFEKNLNQKIKILPINTSLTTNMVILPKKVVIHQLKGPKIAVVIENESIVKMNKEMFEIIWNTIA